MVAGCVELAAQMLLHLMACVSDGKLLQAPSEHAPPHESNHHDTALIEQCLLISLQTLCNSSVHSRALQQCALRAGADAIRCAIYCTHVIPFVIAFDMRGGAHLLTPHHTSSLLLFHQPISLASYHHPTSHCSSLILGPTIKSPVSQVHAAHPFAAAAPPLTLFRQPNFSLIPFSPFLPQPPSPTPAQ